MEFKIGDTVAVLDDVIKGKVVAIKNNAISIESTDGFSFDFLPNELVVIKESQFELSKYSDISNESLLEKMNETSNKKNVPKFKSTLKTDDAPPMEVDLHIHQLTESTRGMDNYDMLNLQIETAKHKIEYAIRNRIPKVVFIHGVGAGVLKTELDFLLKNYHVDVYAASFKKYGLGATEVYIYQNPKK
ncbi:DNA mismatch repair protein MutS [Lutibacter sp. A64]|uniref:DNA mismatch repair protein MutS n=1 Tax=Lutibacter sp. A64 TaxID=2918526 RepID=UPI001F05FB1D|nr:DNA mismatch repair protein MutS [Lutibacter sp. A64]UMB54964.1 DNA mismatch repair protein MutS [Lutibacter sp. A64]